MKEQDKDHDEDKKGEEENKLKIDVKVGKSAVFEEKRRPRKLHLLLHTIILVIEDTDEMSWLFPVRHPLPVNIMRPHPGEDLS